MHWDLIVNPLACAGAAGRRWPGVEKALIARGFSITVNFTDSPATTRRIAHELLASGAKAIAVYGGDGTLSDTAAVLAAHHTAPALAVLPAGSGNDWARSIGLHHPDIPSAMDAMEAFNVALVDTAEADWETGSCRFLNSSGTGLDAVVLHRALSLRRFIRLPKLSYLLALGFSALFPPRFSGRFLCDGKVFHLGGFITFTTGVGCYSGGGMRLSPTAVPDDGLLDGLCLTPMGFFTILRNLGRIFDGTLHTTRWARLARGRVLRFESGDGRPILLELDGEPVDTGSSGWLELKVRPASLSVVVPAGD